MPRLTRLFSGPIFAFLVLGLAACELTVPQDPYPALSYSNLPPIKFDVAAIEIERPYEPNGEPPHVELLFPFRPDQAASNWARDRLVAVGSQRRLRYIIKDASAISTRLETTSGLSGAVTIDQAERYDAQLEVEIQILGDSGIQEGNALARAFRSITIPEDASVNDRERTWYELTGKLMNDLNSQLEDTLKQALFPFIRQ